ncbi:MAG: methyltransferase domain-containing protein [Sulfurimonadaceae bacterium]
MAGHEQIIKLYSELADQPGKDFGWDKGLENAKAHNYSEEWFEKLPSEIWDYCAAVGNPFELGTIEKGSTVLDLGCGAGVDLLVSALLVGETGRAIGVDITPKMVQKAKEHAKLAGFTNVEVLESSFEEMALEDESVDVVISNGAINLTSCKESVFAEIHRVLKPDGKIMFADMIDVSTEDATTCCAASSEEGDWANCVAGTLREGKLIDIMSQAGFGEIECTGLTHYKTSDTTYGATFRAKKKELTQVRQSHWDNVFKTKDYKKVLWHQNSPTVSLELITRYSTQDDAIIDVGCGASFLVDRLIDKGYKNITLLDTSKTSLDIVKSRLATNADIPTYICSDIMHFEPSQQFNIWHDRAVFHFLLLKKERVNYFETVMESLVSGGIAIISTFRVGGQTQCAGLDILQYDHNKMLEELPQGLELIKYEEFTHITPSESEQAYSSFVIRRV